MRAFLAASAAVKARLSALRHKTLLAAVLPAVVWIARELSFPGSLGDTVVPRASDC
jgi:hypothetical protein